MIPHPHLDNICKKALVIPDLLELLSGLNLMMGMRLSYLQIVCISEERQIQVVLGG